jgi:hypothetical protein
LRRIYLGEIYEIDMIEIFIGFFHEFSILFIVKNTMGSKIAALPNNFTEIPNLEFSVSSFA